MKALLLLLLLASALANAAALALGAGPPPPPPPPYTPRGAYLHIPFCRRRCFYCDFPIKVIGDRESTRRVETDKYVELLLREIKASADSGAKQGPRGLESVYFGGGTPSLLSPAQVDRVLACLDAIYGIQAGAEVTLEMDPGTFDLPRLSSFKSAGVNRVSLGVQSFDQTVLTACGRAHTALEAQHAIANMHAAGMDNFSLDLISSLPGATPEQWAETLRSATDAVSPTK